MKVLWIFCFLTVNFFTPHNIMAQWVQTGPEGGSVTCFVNIDTNIFASTSKGGVFLSTDNGSSWTPVNNGLWATSVMSIAVSGTNLFAGTDGAGVFRSTDNGLNWTNVSTGLTNFVIGNLLVANTNLFAGTSRGVFRSSDNGANWDSVNSGLTNTNISALAVSDTNLFAGTWGGGIFRSTNNGTNWDSVNTGLSVKEVIVIAAKDTNLFAGTWGGGIFRSTNNGANWDSVGLLLNGVDSFAFIDSTIFAGTVDNGVFLSTDNGLNWTSTALTNEYVGALYVKGSSLFAGTGRGVFRSMNNGANWTEVNSGMKAATVFSLAISDTNLIAGTTAGIYRSSNNGADWVFANVYGGVFSLATSGTYLFAGGGAHVFRSTNNGATWEGFALPTPQRINALAVNGTYLFAGSSGDGVFRSTINGVGWTPVNNGLTDTVVYSLAVHGTDLFAGTAGGVYRTTDNGVNWTTAGLTNQEIRALTINDTNLFAGTGSGVFRSSDNGTNWDAVNTAFMDVRALTISDTNLFAGGWKVSWSSNNGDSWTNISAGLWGTQRVNALAVNGTYLYTGHHGTSVWRRSLSEIITNDPPIFTSTLPDTGFMEDTILEFPLSVWFDYVEDIDNADSTLVWSIEGNDSVSTVISTDMVTFSSQLNWYGIDTLGVIVSDGEFSDTTALVVNVYPVNDTPVVLEIPPIIFFEDSSYSFDLDTLVIDVDHDTTEISWSASFPTNIIANIHNQLNKKTFQNSRQILEVNREESKYINDESENQNELKTGKIFKHRSALKGKTPIENLQSESINESKEEQSELMVIRQKEKAFSDDTKEPHRVPQISVKFPGSTNSPGISVLGLTQGKNDSLIIVIDSLTHFTTITATLNFYGLDIPVIFTATDDSGASDSDTTTISVNPVNDPPVISQLPDTSFFEDDTLIYPISNWFPYVYDPDTPDGHLSYFVVSGSNVIAGAGNAIFYFYAHQNWFGLDTLKLVVSDSVLSDTADLFVSLLSVNDIPSIYLPDSLVFDANTSDSLHLWDYISDVETSDSLLTKQFFPTNDSLLYNYNNDNGIITFFADSGFSGIVYFNITVIDDSNAVAEDTLIVRINEVISGFDDLLNQIPNKYILFQNYPNPFNPVSTIRYGLPKASEVKIEVYNLLGQKVLTFIDENKKAGYHDAKFDGSHLASGIYLYKIQAGEFQEVRKMILIK